MIHNATRHAHLYRDRCHVKAVDGSAIGFYKHVQNNEEKRLFQEFFQFLLEFRRGKPTGLDAS